VSRRALPLLLPELRFRDPAGEQDPGRRTTVLDPSDLAQKRAGLSWFEVLATDPGDDVPDLPPDLSQFLEHVFEP
jgi:hypothetical protein